jgi:hypothetical protein
MTMAQLSEQSTKSLDRRVAEIDRIDTAVLAATKFGVELPSAAVVFSALNDASIASAEVIDAHGAVPIPAEVRSGLLRLHCSVSDLVTSLRMYGALGHPLKPIARFATMPHRQRDPSQLH